MRKLLTSSQAAVLAGVSVDCVRWNTRQGRLVPAAQAQGVALYDARTVTAWARTVRPRGAKAAA